MKDLKELYTFDVKRTVEKEVPYVKKETKFTFPVCRPA